MKKLIVLVTLLILSFMSQGCGRLGAEGDIQTGGPSILGETFEDMFSYYYKTTPVVYGQLQFVKKSTDKDFQDVAVIAVMGKSDGSVGTLDYELKMINEGGFAVCPSATGRLLAGATSVIESCVSQVKSKNVTVTLKVTLVEGTKNTVFNFEKKY